MNKDTLNGIVDGMDNVKAVQFAQSYGVVQFFSGIVQQRTNTNPTVVDAYRAVESASSRRKDLATHDGITLGFSLGLGGVSTIKEYKEYMKPDSEADFEAYSCSVCRKETPNSYAFCSVMSSTDDEMLEVLLVATERLLAAAALALGVTAEESEYNDAVDELYALVCAKMVDQNSIGRAMYKMSGGDQLAQGEYLNMITQAIEDLPQN